MEKQEEASLINSLIGVPYVLVQEINGGENLRVIAGNGIGEVDDIIGLLLEAAEQIDEDYVQGRNDGSGR